MNKKQLDKAYTKVIKDYGETLEMLGNNKTMSNYYTKAKRKMITNETIKGLKAFGEWEKVEMLDDYFGHHQYGVRFPDGEVYKKEDCIIK